jgi:general secretion pathway protein G
MMKENNRTILRNRRSGAFTFLEIILVVAIIGILAAIVGPRLIGKSKKAKVSATRSQISALKTALGSYEIQMGDFPTTSEGLMALVKKPSGASDDWEQQMDSIPNDPWGSPYIYAYPGQHGLDYDLISKGPDRQEGTEDDVTNFGEVEGGDL